MRKSFNGLSGLVAEHFDIDLFSGHLFVFLQPQARLRQDPDVG